MPNRTIYLSDEIDEKYNNDPDKKGLIAQLLRQHYRMVEVDISPVAKRSIPIAYPIHNDSTPLIDKPNLYNLHKSSVTANKPRREGEPHVENVTDWGA